MLPLTRSRGRQRFFGGGWNPFNQLGPTLDLSFAGVVTDLTDPNGYTLNTNFIAPQYQIAAQYVVWETNVGLVDKTFSQIITFTRASTATFFDSAGVLTSAAVDAPRLDYNPSTLAAQGLLIEEARTNSIRNNTMVGAAAGTPGTAPTNWGVTGTADGITTQVVGTGAENGITYIDLRYSGTATATSFKIVRFEAVNNIAAASGQTWTAATYMRVAAGSAANITAQEHVVVGYNAGGTAVEQTNTPPTVTSTITRFITSRTLNNATTAFVSSYYAFTFNNGAAIDITLRIGLPQLELGAFATSVIPTTTTALTRAADVASVNTLSPWFNSATGTLYAEYNIPVAVQNQAAAALSDGTNNNRMLIRAANASAQTLFIGVATTATQWSGIVVTTPTNATTKSSFAYATNDIAWVRNAGTVGTDATATIPTVTGLKLGADGDGTLPLNGYLRRITYYPRRLSNAELQAITV